jgi:hypothetical protein
MDIVWFIHRHITRQRLLLVKMTVTILDMYSEKPIGTDPYSIRCTNTKMRDYSVEGDCCNREYIIPQSTFQLCRAPAGWCYHHPTDGKVNGQRSIVRSGDFCNLDFLNGSKLGVPTLVTGLFSNPSMNSKASISTYVLLFCHTLRIR